MKLSGAPICWAGVTVPDVLGGAEVGGRALLAWPWKTGCECGVKNVCVCVGVWGFYFLPRTRLRISSLLCFDSTRSIYQEASSHQYF